MRGRPSIRRYGTLASRVHKMASRRRSGCRDAGRPRPVSRSSAAAQSQLEQIAQIVGDLGRAEAKRPGRRRVVAAGIRRCSGAVSRPFVDERVQFLVSTFARSMLAYFGSR